MKYNRIIIFCDYGVDDAVATLHILSHADMFNAIDIVPIGGNVDVDTAYRNAQTLVALVGSPKKVRIVDTRAVAQPSADIPTVHGSDGLGDLFEPQTSTAEVIDLDAFRTELKAKAVPEHDCVLSLGPCSIPVLIGYTPFCTVLMGGTNREQPNYGDYEFNEALDTEAFRKYAFTATAVATLDTCHDPKFDFENMRMCEDVANKLIERCVELCRARKAKIAIYDYCAALAVTNPELFDATRIRRADGVEFNELSLK